MTDRWWRMTWAGLLIAATGVACTPLAAQSAQSGASTLVVRVLAAGSGAPIPGADVSLVAAKASGHTNAQGLIAFRGAAPGEELVEVRALGYAPVRASLTLTAGDTTAVSVTLSQSTATLAPVTIEARDRPELVRDGFYDRKRSSNGRFYTAKDIAEMHPTTPRDILTSVPGLEVNDGGLFANGQMQSGGCIGVAEYIDGVRTSDPGYGDDRNSHKSLAIDNIPIDDIAGMEAYVAPDIPARYNMEYTETSFPPGGGKAQMVHGTPCAVVLVWLRSGGR